MINEKSASASEVLIAAMKEKRKNITLVVAPPMAKALFKIQIISTLNNNHIEFHLTTAEFLTPNKNKINKKEFNPHVSIGYPKKAKKALRTFLLQGELNKFIHTNTLQLRAKQIPKNIIQDFITTTLSKYQDLEESLLKVSVWNEVYRIHDNIIPYNMEYDKVLRGAIPYVFKPFDNTKIAQNTYAMSGKIKYKLPLSIFAR